MPELHELEIGLAADIVIAVINKMAGAPDSIDVATLIADTHRAIVALKDPPAPIEPPAPVLEPAVPIRASVKPDYIVCLEDGKKLKMLKRYLMSNFNLTPEQYRAKWKLPADYPMVAPNYADTRRALAMKIGLGRKPTAKANAKR